MIGALAALLISTPAFGQQWVDRGEVVTKLSRDYTEQPTAMGLANNGGVIEVFTSPDGATWTIIVTMPNGLSMLVAAGENWEHLPIKVSGESS